MTKITKIITTLKEIFLTFIYSTLTVENISKIRKRKEEELNDLDIIEKVEVNSIISELREELSQVGIEGEDADQHIREVLGLEHE